MRNFKAHLVAAFSIGVAVVGLAFAATTGFGSIQLKDVPGKILDSLGNTRISLTTSDVQISTPTFTGGAGLASIGVTASSTTFVPGAAGRLFRDASNNVYVSTSATAGGLVKVGSQ